MRAGRRAVTSWSSRSAPSTAASGLAPCLERRRGAAGRRGASPPPSGGANHGVRRDSSPVQTGEAEEDASSGRVRLRFPRLAFAPGGGGAEAQAEDRAAQPGEAAAAGDRAAGAPAA